MKKKRSVAEIQKEIKAAMASHEELWPRGKATLGIGLYTSKQIESLLHIAWLQGYLQAVRDERGLK